MKQEGSLFRRYAFIWVMLATSLVLLVPLIAMQFTNDVQWDAADFVILGLLLLGMGSLFVLVERRTPRRHRVIVGTVFIAASLYIWAELAVGVFTDLGS